MQRPKPDPPLTSGAERMTPRRHVGRRSPQLGLARGIEASPANSDKSRSATRRLVSLGYTVDGLPAMETSVRAVDEAVLGRLRLAIDGEAGNEEEQLDGVLRMLGAIGGGVESVHGQPYGEDP